jgi:hypothetical protein
MELGMSRDKICFCTRLRRKWARRDLVVTVDPYFFRWRARTAESSRDFPVPKLEPRAGPGGKIIMKSMVGVTGFEPAIDKSRRIKVSKGRNPNLYTFTPNGGEGAFAMYRYQTTSTDSKSGGIANSAAKNVILNQ